MELGVGELGRLRFESYPLRRRPVNVGRDSIAPLGTGGEDTCRAWMRPEIPINFAARRPAMEPESIRPYNEPTSQGAPHLADYWEVVQRRLWLVLLLAAFTTGFALWMVGKRPSVFRSTLSLQVNDPWQQSRALTGVPGLPGLDGYIDPIQSEIEVLGSTPIAKAVVDSLGLRLSSAGSTPRSALLGAAQVSGEVAPTGLSLTYLDGEEVVLVGPDGAELGRARVGTPLSAAGIAFTPLPNPGDGRTYPLQVVPEISAINRVRSGLSAGARESTNIIDVAFVDDDPGMSTETLAAAAAALRAYGARRVAGQASREVEFIEQRLDSAYAQLGESLEAIRQFKVSEAFSDLSVQEQTLVTQSEANASSIATLELQRGALAAVLRQLERGDQGVDQIRVIAELPIEINPQIRDIAGRLQTRKEELQRLRTTEAKTEDHPEVVGLQQQVTELERQMVSSLRSNLSAVESRLQGLGRDRSALIARQRQVPGLENRLATLELQQNLDQGTYEYLLSQLYQARITEAGASPYVEVLDPASDPVVTGPAPSSALFVGSLLGLLVGICGAFFLEYLDRTLRTSSQVRSALGLPVLGIVPELPHPSGSSVNGRPRLVTMDAGEPAAEAYRALRLNLSFADGDRTGVRTVAFTSPGPNEGKSTSAVNLAVLIARQRERVLLVDADLRRPALHMALDVPREPGLADVLEGKVGLDEALQVDVLPGLDVLTAGPVVDSPSDLLTSRTMEDLLKDLDERYNYVIIDSPPILAVTDAAVLAGHADGTVLVVRSGNTDQRAAVRARAQLERVGVEILGVLLNDVSPTTTEESYYFRYIYRYYQKEAATPS